MGTLSNLWGSHNSVLGAHNDLYAVDVIDCACTFALFNTLDFHTWVLVLDIFSSKSTRLVYCIIPSLSSTNWAGALI